MIDRLFVIFCLVSGFAHAAQPSAPAPVSAPLRELPWGQLNFLHTTDTHGWHAGHLQEPSYSADWGDYISFRERMKEKADKNDVDLLVIDTGDRVEGNGLYDGSHPKGRYTSKVFREQHIDVLSSGNHELYRRHTAELEYTKTVPNFKGTYLASNLDILDPKSGDRVPFAPRFRKFTTEKQGIRILAFGFLFDFTGNANNTFVQPVEKTIEEKWFQDAIRDKDVDLILVAGHVAVRSKEYDALHKAIRQVKWDTPIQFFGGHSHIRDYVKYDTNSYALESGRYMETIGFMSISGLGTGGKDGKRGISTTAGPAFARRYIDNNLFSFLSHTALNESDFHTQHGRNVSRYIHQARKSLELDHVHGCAPQDYWLIKAPYPSSGSAISLLHDRILPEMVVKGDRKDKTRLVLINSGAIRFDIFKGPFTRDTTFIVSPFQNGFNYIKNVPYDIASGILSLLNNNGPVFDALAPDRRGPALAPPEQSSTKAHFLSDSTPSRQYSQYRHFAHGGQAPLNPGSNPSSSPDLTPGYTTIDDAGDDGDDTVHAPVDYYRVPNCIQSEVNVPKGNTTELTGTRANNQPETVDVVFIEFLEPWVMLALQYLGAEYEASDIRSYSKNKSFTSMIAEWVETNWQGNC